MKLSTTIPNYDWGNFQKVFTKSFENSELSSVVYCNWKKRERIVDEMELDNLVPQTIQKKQKVGIFGGIYPVRLHLIYVVGFVVLFYGNQGEIDLNNLHHIIESYVCLLCLFVFFPTMDFFSGFCFCFDMVMVFIFSISISISVLLLIWVRLRFSYRV
jgi:hypothetical protein